MGEEQSLENKRCAAMIAAGIKNPNKQDGIDFCVACCPYTYCVVMEHQETTTQVKKKRKADIARKLRAHKVAVDDIALILRVQRRTVQRWLKE